jgi:hypothetical protein
MKEICKTRTPLTDSHDITILLVEFLHDVRRLSGTRQFEMPPLCESCQLGTGKVLDWGEIEAVNCN